MAHQDEKHDGEDHARDSEDRAELEVRPRSTLLPPKTSDDEKAPYANEMLLLSFEGRYKQPSIIKPWWSRLLSALKSALKP